MKKYSVEEVSKILNTNTETVRRWIRNDKLHAEKTSNKTGWEITEKNLVKFLTQSSKYRNIAAMIGSATATGIVGGAAGSIVPIPGMPMFLGGTLLTKALIQTIKKSKDLMNDPNAEQYFESIIVAHEVDVEKKKEEILVMQDKIKVLEKELEEEEQIIKDLKELRSMKSK